MDKVEIQFTYIWGEMLGQEKQDFKRVVKRTKNKTLQNFLKH